jgi:hypothetical protein
MFFKLKVFTLVSPQSFVKVAVVFRSHRDDPRVMHPQRDNTSVFTRTQGSHTLSVMVVMSTVLRFARIAMPGFYFGTHDSPIY